MKKYFLMSLLFVSIHSFSIVLPPPEISAKSYLIEDAQSGQILSQSKMNERIEPASLTKLMTAYLTFEALKDGRLTLDQTLLVSERGWKTEGSRMFLDPKVPASVDDLIKGMIVQSGNDACVTLAEAIAGSEEGFAILMNTKAKTLGMKATHFENATGLPGVQHYTTAEDLAILSSAIMHDFPQYYPTYSIKSFTYNNIKQDNRNLLLYRDSFVDGLKTGYTQSAGYNLIASSHKNNRRVVSVVIGTDSEEARAQESSKLLNWALAAFETQKLYTANEAISHSKIYKGKDNRVDVGFLSDFYVSVPFGEAKDIKPVLTLDPIVIAPIAQGQRVGHLEIMLGDKVVLKKEVVALNEVKEAGFFGRLWDGLVLWIKSLLA